ncbi:MAG: peptide/nickel transport system ATP-binding protein [Planctomycetota bacterium]|jgi:peptide/nickel transport system ATP-binding protein
MDNLADESLDQRSLDQRSLETRPLLAVRDLCVQFNTPEGIARAVDGVGFEVRRRETLAVVGESGCGKSVTALAVMGLLPTNAQVSGSVVFQGDNLLRATPEKLCRLRGNALSIVFQEPMTALNPVLCVGEQIAEVVRLHLGANQSAARARSIDVLGEVGLSDPERLYRSYPHQLSGGQRQRVLIAMAISCEPALLIADEPTTALDVTVQAQILALLEELKERHDLGVLLITHDLGLVAQSADRVLVLYGGEVAEEAEVRQLFRDPRHPYTRGLLASRPGLVERGRRLPTIPGLVPAATAWPSGCRFRTRCELEDELCRVKKPPLDSTGADSGHESGSHVWACHHS